MRRLNKNDIWTNGPSLMLPDQFMGRIFQQEPTEIMKISARNNRNGYVLAVSGRIGHLPSVK